jgi:GNAT superfamily N-acetyltransferase
VRLARLAALEEAPQAFGATLAEWQGVGDREERWRARLADVPFNVLADIDGVLGGMVSGYANGDRVELISMWVAPAARGRGVGDALIGAFLEWAHTTMCSVVELGVKETNSSAIAMYTRDGFVDAGPRATEPGGTPERTMILPAGLAEPLA